MCTARASATDPHLSDRRKETGNALHDGGLNGVNARPVGASPLAVGWGSGVRGVSRARRVRRTRGVLIGSGGAALVVAAILARRCQPAGPDRRHRGRVGRGRAGGTRARPVRDGQSLCGAPDRLARRRGRNFRSLAAACLAASTRLHSGLVAGRAAGAARRLRGAGFDSGSGRSQRDLAVRRGLRDGRGRVDLHRSDLAPAVVVRPAGEMRAALSAQRVVCGRSAERARDGWRETPCASGG